MCPKLFSIPVENGFFIPAIFERCSMKFQHLFVVAVTAIILSGCATPPPQPPASLSALSSEQQAQFASTIRAVLKDPDSARFGDMVIVDNGYGACVEVNSKNSMGGYSGFQQAVLVHSETFGWSVATIKDSTRDICIRVLHDQFLRHGYAK
jgi:hypothetical protein